MNKLKPATLATIFSEVLANLAFMFTEEDVPEPAPDAQWIETEIAYRGPVSGTLRLRCSVEFSVLLAANLLGVDSEDADAESKAMDAVKEFMNVLCGQFVTAVHGSDHVFNLSIPRLVALAQPPDLTRADGPELATFAVDAHPIQLVYAPGDA